MRKSLAIGALVLLGIVGFMFAYRYHDCRDFLAIEGFEIDPQLIPAKPHCSCEKTEMLSHFESADPDRDAEIAIANGDFRLRSLFGYDLPTPGVSDIELRKELGNIPIEGSEFAPKCYEHLRLRLIVGKYAHIYNSAILEHVVNGAQQ